MDLMRIARKGARALLAVMLFCALFIEGSLASSHPRPAVRIEVTNDVASLPVVADVIPDLRKALAEQGYHLAQPTDLTAAPIRLVLSASSGGTDESANSPETFAWEPQTESGDAAGGNLTAPTQLSLEAGILWLTDRLSCTGEIPASAHKATRAFARSFIYLSMPELTAQGDPERAIQKALEGFQRDALIAARDGATDVVMYGFNHVFVWDTASRPLAERYREFYRRAAAIAHQMGLRLFLYGDEFIYQPAWLKAQGARLSTSDPKLWQAMASKYRQVLTALPSIDGIMTRTGEVIPWPGVQAFDLIHDRGDHNDRDIVDNYREYLQTLHHVIVGEFGKTYVHRTWSTNNFEQASVPEVYQEIFNSDLPTRDFFAGIKLTLTDQWEYQPINPTFGVTPHATLATIEISRCTSPIIDYAMPFIQSGLQYAREHGAVGILGGVSPGQYRQNLADTTLDESVAYTIWRLSWTPNADLHSILRDWAGRRLGSPAAQQVADMLPALGDIVRDSWYLRPVAERNWNPQQLFGGAHFEIKGNPIWDRGAGQDRFLREIYLTCTPWMRETMAEVAEGIWRYDRILSRWDSLEPVLTDPAVGKAWRQRIWRTREALNMYRAYVQTFLICDAYRDTPTPALRNELAYRVADLKKTMAGYEVEPDHFRLGGIPIFLDIAERTLADREALERYLAEAPTPEEIDHKLRAAEAHDSALAKSCPSAETFLSWAGAIDGRDVFVLQGKKLTDERRIGNPPHDLHVKIEQAIPERPLTYFLARHAGRGWVVLVQSPSAENGWTAKIFVDDPQVSEDVYRFDLKGAESCGTSAP
jgi:hypothetical protein